MRYANVTLDEALLCNLLVLYVRLQEDSAYLLTLSGLGCAPTHVEVGIEQQYCDSTLLKALILADPCDLFELHLHEFNQWLKVVALAVYTLWLDVLGKDKAGLCQRYRQLKVLGYRWTTLQVLGLVRLLRLSLLCFRVIQYPLEHLKEQVLQSCFRSVRGWHFRVYSVSPHVSCNHVLSK